VIADDLTPRIADALRAEQIGGRVGIPAVRASPVVGDLLKVWAARPAMALRYATGLVPGVRGCERGVAPPGHGLCGDQGSPTGIVATRWWTSLGHRSTAPIDCG